MQTRIAWTFKGLAGWLYLAAINQCGLAPLICHSSARVYKTIIIAVVYPKLNPIEMVLNYVQEKGFCNKIFNNLEVVIDQLCSTIKNFTEDAYTLILYFVTETHRIKSIVFLVLESIDLFVDVCYIQSHNRFIKHWLLYVYVLYSI